MLERKTSNQGLSSWRGSIPVGNRYTVGPAAEIFFKTLKEKGQILGSRCNRCEMTYVPVRMFCERCFSELREVVPVGDRGILVAFTRVAIDLEGRRMQEPQTIGAARLEGASTLLIHRVLVPIQKARIGMKVRLVLEPLSRRSGGILDIRGFEGG